jgi:aminoglycoside phosphotransferase (APT) family kinase protein
MNAPERGKLLGAGKEAEAFEFGEQVLKLYRAGASKSSAFREAANLAAAERQGLPAPAVAEVRQFEGRWGIVMSRAKGRPFADAMVTLADATTHLAAMAELHSDMHSRAGIGLAGLKERLGANIERTPLLTEPRKRRLLDGLAAMPAGDRFCHGDFHPWNVLGDPRAATVVDWLDACSGPPAADVCRSYVLIRHPAPGLAAAYVDVYAAHTGIDREAILAWLPFVAAARLAEGVPQEVEGLLNAVERGLAAAGSRADDGP